MFAIFTVRANEYKFYAARIDFIIYNKQAN